MCPSYTSVNLKTTIVQGKTLEDANAITCQISEFPNLGKYSLFNIVFTLLHNVKLCNKFISYLELNRKITFCYFLHIIHDKLQKEPFVNHCCTQDALNQAVCPIT